MNLNRKPAKEGSAEHKRRISESLKRYHKNKNKPKRKPSLLGKLIKSHFSPENKLYRKIQKDPEVRKATKAARQAEHELYMAHKVIKLSPEALAKIRKALSTAKEREDRARINARNKT